MPLLSGRSIVHVSHSFVQLFPRRLDFPGALGNSGRAFNHAHPLRQDNDMLPALTIAILALAQQNQAPMNDATMVFEARATRYTGGEYKDEEFHYQVLRPAKIEEGKKYPIVIFLHGAGERGDDNRAQLKYFPTMMAKAEYREKHPCFLIAPQCRGDKSWAGFGRLRGGSGEMPAEPTDQLKVVMQILDNSLKMYPVDTSRIYLTGLSMGGYGSWDWAIREPDRFAAVVPICGGGDESRADRLIKTPIWAFHGDKDNVVPPEASRTMIAAIKKAGGEPKYTELPGVGHDSWTPAYSDPKGVVPWMFEQRKK
jgi:predicted peptidase